MGAELGGEWAVAPFDEIAPFCPCIWMHVVAAETGDGDAIAMFDQSSAVGVKSWSPMSPELPPHTSAQEELSETKIPQDSNSMAFLIDNLPIIWWRI